MIQAEATKEYRMLKMTQPEALDIDGIIIIRIWSSALNIYFLIEQQKKLIFARKKQLLIQYKWGDYMEMEKTNSKNDFWEQTLPRNTNFVLRELLMKPIEAIYVRNLSFQRLQELLLAAALHQ